MTGGLCFIRGWCVCVCVCVCRCGGIKREGCRRSMICSVSCMTMATKRTCDLSLSLSRARALSLYVFVCVYYCIQQQICTHKLVCVCRVCVCVCVCVCVYYWQPLTD